MTVRARILSILALAVLFGLSSAPGRAGTWVAFQNSYTRSTGAPVTLTDTFTLLNANTQYTLKAFNGGLQNDTTELVSNSVVYLNGAQVLGPANFNQNVAEVNVAILPGLSNTLSVQVRGKPGGLLTIQVIGVDNDPPVITASLSPAPNAAGWNNSPVTVTFTCSDKTSGVASCPTPAAVTTEGANQVVSGTATDLAGNTANTSVSINLDMTPPTITGTINPPPDASGYNSTAVTVTFTCADALSGVASCSPPVSLTTEGAFPETGTAVDVAGNNATTTITVNISFNYFKIRSWQTNPPGDPLLTGKCLDYGSQGAAGATVYLNDCSAAHPIRVVEIGDRTGNGIDPSTGSPIVLHHEVMLFAGRTAIGVGSPLISTLAGSPPATGSSPTEYSLELQIPWNRPPFVSNPANQIFRLDGDGIILEGTHLDATTGNLIPGPCINTNTSATLCPPPPPQLVIQIQNARGATGSPLVAAVRNLADNEFWDFVAIDGSGKYPTNGFVPVAASYDLWNALCTTPTVNRALGVPAIGPSTGTVLAFTSYFGTGVYTGCAAPNAGWGSVIVVTDSDPNECAAGETNAMSAPGIGPCIDMSYYPPLVVPAGVTIRGNRRGTNFGPQLYLNDFAPGTRPFPPGACEDCVLSIQGDYARVTGLRLRGQSRLTSADEPGTEAVHVFSPVQAPGSLTEFISTVDHNDMSDWGSAGVTVANPDNTVCSGAADSCGVANDSATLADVTIARNFLHHNERDNDGYGVLVGRAVIEGNTFLMNRHSIAAGGESHTEYRASYNLVQSSPQYCDTLLGPFDCYHNQDFDMHGTGGGGYGGAGGFYVNIVGNTFLEHDGHDYWLRGIPIFETNYQGNRSLRKENGALDYVSCTIVATCSNDRNGSPFPINIQTDNQFADSAPPYTDPTAQLGVGDFDGDGNDDLFLATGAAWYYSPGGQREWRFLSAKTDSIDSLLLGDFDGDGRTDIVGINPSGQLVVSWGGVSDFELLNANPVPCSSTGDMAVGDFDGDGHPDIFCADGTTWWISYGGNTPFVQAVVQDSTRVKDLRFGDFDGDGTTDVFGVVNGTLFTSPRWQVRHGIKGNRVGLTVWQPLPVSLTNNPASVDGLLVADFDGDGTADIAENCSSGGILGFGGSPGWVISYGGAQAWSACNSYSTSFSLVVGGIGRFSGGRGADILLWDNSNGIGVFPNGIGPSRALSTQDMR